MHVSVLMLTALALGAANARLLLQDDAAGTTLTGPHTEMKTYDVAGNGGCQTFETTPDRTSFNYTSTISYAALPSGCSASDLQVTKVFARGACAETRANNYGVKSLGIVNDPSCFAIAANDSSTCTSVFSTAASTAIVSSVTNGQQVDSGEICWPASFVYVFARNNCTLPISVTVTNLFNDYSGSCTKNDGDDGDHAATASNSGGDVSASTTSASGGGGLSSGAKAGIAIGVILGVALIAAAAYFLCCQLRRG